MRIEQFLSPERTLWGASSTSKKKALQDAADFIAKELPGLESKNLFRALMDRERLGSTGLGEGIAIPHCRIEACQEIVGALVTLAEGIEFEASDGKPVDILFILLVPGEASDQHLKVLAHLASMFSQADFRQALRQAGSSQELFRLASTLDSA